MDRPPSGKDGALSSAGRGLKEPKAQMGATGLVLVSVKVWVRVLARVRESGSWPLKIRRSLSMPPRPPSRRETGSRGASRRLVGEDHPGHRTD